MRFRHIIACLLMSTPPAIAADSPSAPPHQVAAHVTVRAEFEYDYLVTLPDGYDADPAQRWPLLVFLHGIGERGTDVQRVRKHGLPRYLDDGHRLPFVIVAPQCPDDEWWNLPAVEAYITSMVHRYRVDPDRVYLVGLSMGGYATWALAARHPERYAAVIPICGGGETRWAPRLRDLPLWAFHGALDETVPAHLSQDMIDAIKAAGGSPRFTLYPDAHHDAWTATFNNPEIYRWLLEHGARRGRAKDQVAGGKQGPRDR